MNENPETIGSHSTVDDPGAGRPPLGCVGCLTIFLLLMSAWMFWMVRKYLGREDWVLALIFDEFALAIGLLGLSFFLAFAIMVMPIFPPSGLQESMLKFGEWAAANLMKTFTLFLVLVGVGMLLLLAWAIFFGLN